MTRLSHGIDVNPVLLHVHMPKTAGTALNDIIVEMCRQDEWTEDEDGWLVCGVYYARVGIEDQFRPDDEARRVLQRRDLKAVVGHFPFGLHESIDRPCRYVTLLRHPVERILSLYHHIRTWDNEEIHDEVVSRSIGLDAFVRDVRFVECDNGQTRRMAGVSPPFGECGPELLERAKTNLVERFEVAGLTERFVESVVLMRRRLGWPAVPFAKRRNVNHERPRDPASALAGPLLDAVVERNRLDLKLYAFAEQRFDEQVAAEGSDFRDECAQLLEATGEVALSSKDAVTGQHPEP